MSHLGTYLKILLSFFCFCCRAGHGRGRPRQQVQTCAPTGDWEFQISDFGFRIYLRWTPLCSGSDFGPNGHRERISNCRPRNSWLPCRSSPLSSTNWPNKFSSNLLGLLSHTDIMAQGLVLRWTGTDEDVRANRWMGTGMDKEVPANRIFLLLLPGRVRMQTCAPTGDWEFQISDFGFRIYLRWTPLCSGSDFGPNGHRERISNCRPRNSWLPCRSSPLSSTNWPNKFSSNLLGLLSHTDIMAQGLVLRWTGTDEDVRANRWMGTGMDKEVPANRSILNWNHQTPFTYSHIYTFSHLHSWTPKPAEFPNPDF